MDYHRLESKVTQLRLTNGTPFLPVENSPMSREDYFQIDNRRRLVNTLQSWDHVLLLALNHQTSPAQQRVELCKKLIASTNGPLSTER